MVSIPHDVFTPFQMLYFNIYTSLSWKLVFKSKRIVNTLVSFEWCSLLGFRAFQLCPVFELSRLYWACPIINIVWQCPMRHCTVVLKSTSIQLHFLIVVFLMHYCVFYHIPRGQNSPKIVATGQIRLNLDIIMCEFFPSIENMQLRFLSFPFCPTSCSSSNNAHLTGILHLTSYNHLTSYKRSSIFQSPTSFILILLHAPKPFVGGQKS